jgi:hypothetical protein
VKRLPTKFSKTYSMLQLYRDDLERMVAIVGENCDEVRVEAAGYKLSNMSDLDQLQKKMHLETLSDFSVSGRIEIAETYTLTYLDVVLKSDDFAWPCLLSLSDASNTKLYGAAMQIDSLLSARRSRMLEMITNDRWSFVRVFLFISIAAFALVQLWTWYPRLTPDATPWLVVLFGSIASAFTTNFVISWVGRRYRLNIYLTDAHTHRTLTREQRRQLLNGGVGYVLGILSTVIAELIIRALTR